MVRRLALLIGIVAAFAGASGASAMPDASTAPVLVVQGPLPPLEAIFAWSPDSRVLASVSAITHVLQVWDTGSGNLIQSVDMGNLPTRLAYSADLHVSADKRRPSAKAWRRW